MPRESVIKRRNPKSKRESWNDVQRRVRAAGGSREDASAEWTRVKDAGLALIKTRKPKPKPAGREPKDYDKNGRRIPEASKATQFKKGNRASVGHGRPRGPSLRTAIRMALREDDVDYALELARTARVKALNGDFSFFRWISEQLDGKVPDQLIADVFRSGPLGHLTDEELAEVEAAKRAQEKREKAAKKAKPRAAER